MKIHGLLFTEVKEDYKNYIKTYIQDHLALLGHPSEFDRILTCLENKKMDPIEDVGQYLESLMLKFPKYEEELRYLALAVLSN